MSASGPAPYAVRTPPRTWRVALLAFLLIAGALVSMHVAGLRAERERLRAAAEQAREQLDLFASGLQTLIDRYRALPAVLALDGELRQLLAAPLTPEAQRTLDLKLERINAVAGSTSLQVMDRDGLTVAASNWRAADTYVGHRYGFRPYFTEARERGTGRFYGVGVTTGQPGYFLSHAVRGEQGDFLGVVVVKLEFSEVEQAWARSPHVILVSDALDIAFIANREPWRYRELAPIDSAARERLAQTRQYDRQPLLPSHFDIRRQAQDDVRMMHTDDAGIAGDYLWRQHRLEREGWTLHLLQDSGTIPGSGRAASLAAGGAWLALSLLALVLQQRCRIARLRRRDARELQRLVDERTRALRTAQDSLVQAAKLAALGQMSAALAHEIKQPLTALQVHLGSLRMMLEDGDLDDARQALPLHEDLLQRIAALAAHLKTYARQSPGGLEEPLALDDALDNALHLLAPRLRDSAVRLQRTRRPEAWVRGDAIRVEQVLVNLLRNALDAVDGTGDALVRIDLDREGPRWALAISDNGGGIAEADMPRLFDPFFTTKPVGEGLGLGLAVSYAIVHGMGGGLAARNVPGGACFTLRLDASEPPQEPDPCPT